MEETKAFLASKDAGQARPADRDAAAAARTTRITSPNKWTPLLHNKRDAASDITANFAFHSWVRDSLLANTPYDQMVRELLAATGTIASNPAVAWYKRVKEPTQQLEDVAQLFLGVRMQCAQCHHHPFERWSQDDYYSFAAFFSQVGRKPTTTAGEDLIFHKRGIAQTENKKTRLPVKPAALGAPTLDIPPDEDPRLQLADWLSDKTNPFFAKSLVNRYWKHFFQRGLIEPEDDIRDTNPPTNPELLDALAKHFIESGYDLKDVVRVDHAVDAPTSSARSRTSTTASIGRTSRAITRSICRPRCCSMRSTSSPARRRTSPTCRRARARSRCRTTATTAARGFLKVFGRPEGASVCECERVQSSSLAQSLHLMNAADVKAKLATSNGRADRLAKATAPESGEAPRALPRRIFPRAARGRVADRRGVSRQAALRRRRASRSTRRRPSARPTRTSSGR